jgi:hypothetical protein
MHNAHKLSRHAATRCQQRGIKGQTVDLILAFGERRRTRDGATSVFLTRHRIEDAKRHLPKGEVAQLEKQRGVYLVVAESGTVITVAWRHGRSPR